MEFRKKTPLQMSRANGDSPPTQTHRHSQEATKPRKSVQYLPSFELARLGSPVTLCLVLLSLQSYRFHPSGVAIGGRLGDVVLGGVARQMARQCRRFL